MLGFNDPIQLFAAVFVVTVVNGGLLTFAFYHYKQLKKLRKAEKEYEDRIRKREHLYADLEL
jgi:hypothetical protein